MILKRVQAMNTYIESPSSVSSPSPLSSRILLHPPTSLQTFHSNGSKMSRGYLAQQKTGMSLTSALNFTSAMAFSSFSVMFRNFYCGVNKLLPQCSEIFAVMFRNFCHDVHKLLPWCSQTLLNKLIFRQFQNKFCSLKLKG